MKTICLYFQVHQPFRLRPYSFLDIGKKHDYYNDELNRSIMERVAKQCYLKTNLLISELIKKYPKQFNVSYSISGPAIEQFEGYAPEVLESFQALARTGNTEFFAETYNHSLAAVASESDFMEQVVMHKNKIESAFDYKVTTFRNTELIYSNHIGKMVADMGFKTILTEGLSVGPHIRPNDQAYHCPLAPSLKILLRNYRLSDDISFRFSDQNWKEWPLTPVKYLSWIKESTNTKGVCNLFMDYETFGEHQPENSGIFEFLRQFTEEAIEQGFIFSTPHEISARKTQDQPLNVPEPISWADEARDLSAWLGNEMQKEAFEKLYQLKDLVAETRSAVSQQHWLRLQMSDHFYYMCDKFFPDGDVHAYFNPYNTPYAAFMNFMNVLSDFEDQLKKDLGLQDEKDVEIQRLKNIIKGLTA